MVKISMHPIYFKFPVVKSNKMNNRLLATDVIRPIVQRKENFLPIPELT